MSDQSKTNQDSNATRLPSPSTFVPPAKANGETTWATASFQGWSAPHVHLNDPDPVDSPEPDPTAVGRYLILGEIARGGMGAVMRGRDTELNRDLAVKVLLEKYRDHPEILRRFFEEAQIGGQLQHPGIVPIYDLGTFPDKRPFFAMKLVKGRTLSALLKERATPAADLPRFLSIFEQVSQTVAYAHSRGVIHRDLKPDNVMVGAFGEVQVMDWGLAKVLASDGQDDRPTEAVASVIQTPRSDSNSDASHAGSVMGTPGYMAPEQARGEIETIDERADVFGLGAILCKILTGEAAITGRNSGEILRKTQKADLSETSTRLLASGTDPELIAIARSCLAAEPLDRPRNAEAVASAIKGHLEGVQERLRTSEIARVQATARARSVIAMAGSVLLAVVVVGGSWVAYRLDRDSQMARTESTVGAAMGSAEALRAEAERTGPDNLEAWNRALIAADKARDLLANRPARKGLEVQVVAMHEAIDREATKARVKAERRETNRKLVAALDEARLEGAQVKDGYFDLAAVRTSYAKAFRVAGIDPLAMSLDQCAQLLSGSTEDTRVAAALDDWAASELDRPRAARLVAIARRIDPDPFRNRFRDALRTAKDLGKNNLTDFGGHYPYFKGFGEVNPTGYSCPAPKHGDLLSLVHSEQRGSLPAASVVSLAHSLERLGLKEESIALLTRASLRFPGDFWIHQYLGQLYTKEDKKGKVEAVRYCTVAVALRPDSPGARYNLGIALSGLGRHAEAADEFRAAIRLKPDLAEAHNSLGTALSGLGRHVEAVDELRAAIRLKPDYAEAHINLGNALSGLGRLAEAADEYRAAIKLKPDSPGAHFNLGIALSRLGRLAEAADEYRAAIRLKPDYAEAHYDLGNALHGLGRHAQAADEFRAAIRLKPDYAEAHCNLGHALRMEGKVREALASLLSGHHLGSKQPGWSYPSGQWVQQCERLVALEDRLQELLAGTTNTTGSADLLALGRFCYDTKRFAVSARFWGEALATDPKLGDDREKSLRYDAACFGGPGLLGGRRR